MAQLLKDNGFSLGDPPVSCAEKWARQGGIHLQEPGDIGCAQRRKIVAEGEPGARAHPVFEPVGRLSNEPAGKALDRRRLGRESLVGEREPTTKRIGPSNPRRYRGAAVGRAILLADARGVVGWDDDVLTLEAATRQVG